jgi:hypothetical protein
MKASTLTHVTTGGLSVIYVTQTLLPVLSFTLTEYPSCVTSPVFSLTNLKSWRVKPSHYIHREAHGLPEILDNRHVILTSVWDRVDLRSCSAAGRIKSMTNINVPNRNRNRELQHCSAVPQLTAPAMQNLPDRLYISREADTNQLEGFSIPLHRCQNLTCRTMSALYLAWTPTLVVCHTDMNASLLPHMDVSIHPITSPRVSVPALIPRGINITTCGTGMWLYRPPSPVKER